MTTAEPTSQATSSTSIVGSLMWLRNAPRWVHIAFIVALVVVGYWIYKTMLSNSSDGTTNRNDVGGWRDSALAFLTTQGYSQQTSRDAIHAYTHGEPLTPSQIQLIASAIGAIGLPDGFTTDPITTAQVGSSPTSGSQILGGGAGNPVQGGTSQASPGAPYPTNTSGATTAYWNVPVGKAGWSSTFAGISSQFYGNTANATQLLELNPGLSDTTWGKLPVGKIIKVPRPSS